MNEPNDRFSILWNFRRYTEVKFLLLNEVEKAYEFSMFFFLFQLAETPPPIGPLRIEDSQRKNGGASEVHYTRMRTESYCKATKEISEELPRFVSQEMFIFPSKLIEFFSVLPWKETCLNGPNQKAVRTAKSRGFQKARKNWKRDTKSLWSFWSWLWLFLSSVTLLDSGSKHIR